MADCRKTADELEPLLDDQYLVYPTYGKLLFSVK
jgi:glutamine synthetase type III